MRRWMRRGERGMALPLVALLAVALTGMTAFSIDIGRIAQTRRHLQNAADAAALGGAAYLPASPTAADGEARRLARANGLSDAEIQSVTIAGTNFDNDTIEVSVQRSVSHLFARVLGITSTDVSARAKVLLQVTQGIDTQQRGAFPYAVWGGNAGGPEALNWDPSVTKRVTYRSNDYDLKNVQTIPSDVGNDQCKHKFKGNTVVYNCNWNINSSTFKGYFHWKNRYVWIDSINMQTFNQGGNAFGTDLAEELTKYQQAGIPIWLPVVTRASDQSNQLQFTVVNFVCVLLDPIDPTGSADWTGVIQNPRSAGCAKGVGLPTGGQNPAPTLQPVYNYRLVE
jgi:Flp pilus assembly protein TadG